PASTPTTASSTSPPTESASATSSARRGGNWRNGWGCGCWAERWGRVAAPAPTAHTDASDATQLPLPFFRPLRSTLRPAAVRRPPPVRHAAEPAQQESGRCRHQARDRHVPDLEVVPREQ